MSAVVFRYAAWFLAAVAAAALTVTAFSLEHFERFTSGASIGRDAAPYVFFLSGLVFLGSFLVLALRQESDLVGSRSAARRASSWAELHDLAAANSLGREAASYVRWAERQKELCGAVAPDSEGWLARQSDIADQSSAIRMVAGVLIVLGIVFTFEAIASSTAQLSKAVQASVAEPSTAQVVTKRPAKSGAAAATSGRGTNGTQAEDGASRLQHEIALALDPLAQAFGANLNGILFTIDLLVLLALLQLLDKDSQRLLREFVLDHAEPLLLAEYATTDPTHALMREVSKRQGEELAHIATQVVEQIDIIITRSNAATAKEISAGLATVSEQLASTSEAVEAALTQIVDAAVLASTKTAELTAKKLTATVSQEFKLGLEALNGAVAHDVPTAFSNAATRLTGTMTAAAGDITRSAAQAVMESMASAREVGSALAAGAQAVAVSANEMSTTLNGASTLAGERLLVAAKAAAEELRSASAAARQEFEEANARAGSELVAAVAGARQALHQEARVAAEALEELRGHLDQTSTELRDAADALFASADRHTQSTDRQIGAVQAFSGAASTLESAASRAQSLVGPLVAAVERVASSVSQETETLKGVAASMASANRGLQESAAVLKAVPDSLDEARTEIASASETLVGQMGMVVESMRQVVDIAGDQRRREDREHPSRSLGIADRIAAGRPSRVRLATDSLSIAPLASPETKTPADGRRQASGGSQEQLQTPSKSTIDDELADYIWS